MYKRQDKGRKKINMRENRKGKCSEEARERKAQKKGTDGKWFYRETQRDYSKADERKEAKRAAINEKASRREKRSDRSDKDAGIDRPDKKQKKEREERREKQRRRCKHEHAVQLVL